MPRLWEIVDGLPAERKPRLLRGYVGYGGKESVIMLGGWNRTRRCILLRRRSKDVRRIAMAKQPRRRGRPKKNALTLVQTEFDFVEDKVGRYWNCCALVTNDEKLDASSLAQIYRDRGDCENNFDEYKNQYCWGGFVTKDLMPCRAIARLIAIVANW